jgi:serine protease Do/serine protease DegQ
MPDSAADKAGVQVSEVIVGIDGEEVNGSRQLRNRVGLMLQEQQVELALYRNGKRETLQARIGGASGQAVAADSLDVVNKEFRGAMLETTRGNNSLVKQGVEVVSLSQSGGSWAAGLREGDVIIEVNRRQIADLEAFNAATSANAEGSSGSLTALTIIRDGRRMLLFLP